MFDAVASINRRIAHWVAPYSTLKSRPLYVYTLASGISSRLHLFSTGWPITGTETPRNGSFIESMSDQLLVGVYTASSPNATMMMVVDKRVSSSSSGTVVVARQVTIRLSERVISAQSMEGSAEGGHPTCNKIMLGNVLTLTLSGGMGQLVGLDMTGTNSVV
jgi:hypothetical protein